MSVSVRLDRLLSNMGYGTRKEIQALVKAGGVLLDGEKPKAADLKVEVTPALPERLSVNGRPLDPPPGLALILNKPLGVTCSHKEAGPLVYDLLPKRWRRREPAISTVGRLDKETSGLLILTDDGELLHKIISPKRHLPKRYLATLARPLTGQEGAAFAAGTLMLEGEEKPLLPATLEPLGEKQARLTITEGRYHQVRRMFAAVGNHVEALHREGIGGFDLPADLLPGQWRLATEADIAALLTAPS